MTADKLSRLNAHLEEMAPWDMFPNAGVFDDEDIEFIRPSARPKLQLTSRTNGEPIKSSSKFDWK